jgi:hypothetical protein
VADPVVNFGYTTVAVAPTPADSGTTVEFADPAVLPGDPGDSGPYNLVIWPADVALALASNAEIIRCVALAAGVFTIDREQEGTSPRTIVVGDQVALAATAKTFHDLLAAAQAVPALSAIWTGVQIDVFGQITGYAGGTPIPGGQILVGRNSSGALELRQIPGWTWDDTGDAGWSAIAVGGIALVNAKYIVGEDLGLVIGTAGVVSTAGHPMTVEGGVADRADHVGADLQLDGGPSRGNQVGGDIVFRTTGAGSSASIAAEQIKAGGTGANVEISGTLAQIPFLPSLAPIQGAVDEVPLVTDAAAQAVTFNVDGTITGDTGSGGTNTWDPTTGAYSFSFAGASTGPVNAAYVIEGKNAFVEQARLRASDGALLMKPPTSDPSIPGVVWNNAGTLAIS